jgi:hypothetical protein
MEVTNASKQQLLSESREGVIIDSLYSASEPERGGVWDEVACPECDSILDVTYDSHNTPKYFCDNCCCSVQGSVVLSLADMDITQDIEA